MAQPTTYNQLEKQKSSLNRKADDDGGVVEARIIANYGDPGIDEDYGFDILSRFLVVSIESSDIVPTLDSWNKRLAIVFRPENLWIDAEEGLASSPSSQKRSDAIGNVNQGLASSPTTNGIARISSPYRINEIIRIKKLSNKTSYGGTDPSLDSVFAITDEVGSLYNPWHTEGSTFNYFAGNSARIGYLREKTLTRFEPTAKPYRYGMSLDKYQYEAFYFFVAAGAGAQSDQLTAYAEQMFENELDSNLGVYNVNGGYLFKTSQTVNFRSVDYIDLNINNKQRITVNDCMPLIVTTPGTFPTPKIRTLGTTSYNPSYATIIKQN